MTLTPSAPLRFQPYGATAEVANIVVDGSPNASTVLTLTHWPGIAHPPGLAADLSAEMAFRYLDQPPEHDPASVVTNNHFDQDGLVGIFALIDPAEALRHRDVLIDVAAAGDFATYQFRAAARASMALWSYAQADRSPLGNQLDGPYDAAAALLYETTLPLLIPMLTHPERFEELWRDEDERLTASEAAIADGHIVIEEVAAVDLAVVTIRDHSLGGGHRFGHDTVEFMHPMAVHNATHCSRLLLIRDHDVVYVDRYESWVQYQSRNVPSRVDLEPLAQTLTALETGAATWSASPPSALTPRLRPNATSSLTAATITAELVARLEHAPAAWDPYRRDNSGGEHL
jgi:hypothetical protein